MNKHEASIFQAAHTVDALPREAQRLTGGSAAVPQTAEQLLYFTSPSVTADNRFLVVIAWDEGHPNLALYDLQSGARRLLTRQREVYLKQYVYFDGTPFRGFARASVSLDARRHLVYFLQGREVCVVNFEGDLRVLATLPDDQVTAFTHVSECGRYLCVPTTDARALDDEVLQSGPLGEVIDRTVREENLNSYLRVFDTHSGALLHCETVPRGWVTHVQFSPVNPQHILYNHEWAAGSGARRVWLWDGESHRQLRPPGGGRRADDWACHEMWERDGQHVIYHGGYHAGPPFIGRVHVASGAITEIPFPENYQPYGHFTTGRSGWLVTDGYYVPEEVDSPPDSVADEVAKPPAKQPWAGRWLCLLDVDWPRRAVRWIPLREHGSSWRSQDEHPHPIFSHDGDAFCFTSDHEGARAVYRVDVKDIVES